MKNKGFTLIELLAVIVILAIIALIATPIILGIINDARKEAKERSAELAYSGVEYAVTTYMYKTNGNTPTTVAEIAPYFNAENVKFVVDTENGTAQIQEDNGSKLCDVTVTENVFTIDCGEYMAAKKIFATE